MDDDVMEPNYEYSDAGYPVKEPVAYFAVLLREPNKIRLINVGPELVSAIQERLEQLVTVDSFGYVIFKDYLQTSFTGRFNIYDLILEKAFFEKPAEEDMKCPALSKEDMTLIKVAFCRVLGTLFCYGYDVVVSSDLARDSMTHSTVFFRLRDPRRDILPAHYYSHKFICVAPYGIDSILLINIPKVTIEPILKIIHLTWSPGIKSKQTLADDERSVSVVISLKLSGTPWNQAVYNSGKATIQARLIILEVARILSQHKWRFAANINFSGTTDSFFFQWCPNLEMEELRYCALILSRYDRLRLLQVPSNMVSVIRECVNKQWYLQLLKQKDYHGTVELKLGGCPWWADGNDAVEARYFISSLVGTLKSHGWEVCGTVDLSRHNNDKSTLLLKQCRPSFAPHMCVSFNKANRIRLIVSSSEISEESELQLTTKMNEVIKQRWVALGPRNYGKSIEWKLEGEPWDTEGLYADHTRGIYLLCLLLEAIQPLGWRLVSSADISSKNLDANERGYALIGKPEDMHTWFFLYDESLRAETTESVAEMHTHTHNLNTAYAAQSKRADMSASLSVPNLEQSDPVHHHPGYFQGGHFVPPPAVAPPPTHQHQQQQQHNFMMYGHAQSVHAPPTSPPPQVEHAHHCSSGGGLTQHHSRSVPSVAAAVANAPTAMDPYASRTSLNHEISSSRPQSRSHSHFCHQQLNHGQQQQQQPCLANGRCQSRQKVLMRQASAGSLPPEHHQQHLHHVHHGVHHHHHHHPAAVPMHYSFEDGGYKSDGEAYNICYNKQQGPVQVAANHHHHHHPQQQRIRHHTASNSCNNRPMRSLSGQLVGPQQQQPQEMHQHRSNGYLSDGEGYIIQNQMARVSRSGKYGSQASSPRSDRHLHDPMLSDDDEDEDEEDEDDEDDIEAEIHMNDLKEQAKGAQDQDLIVSYSAFQAEAAAAATALGKFSKVESRSSKDHQAAPYSHHRLKPGSSSKEQLFTVHAVSTTTTTTRETATMRRSNSNGCVMDEPGSQPKRPPSAPDQPNGQQRGSRRSSRSNSRQDLAIDNRTTLSKSRGGGASSSQSDQRSDGGYKSDGWYQQQQRCGSQPPTTKRPDGYRSEGSTESPKHMEANQVHHHHAHGLQAVRPRSSSRTSRPSSSQPASSSSSTTRGSTVKHQPSCDNRLQQPPAGSRSLQSFQRQESTGSFYSSHSAPNCGSHRHHVQHGHVQQRPQGQAPAPVAANLESCSTQSSSSSASGPPPDYNSCSGPPAYDQAKRGYHLMTSKMGEAVPKVPPHQNRSSQLQQQQQAAVAKKRPMNSSKPRQAGSNELYYMGEFYG